MPETERRRSSSLYDYALSGSFLPLARQIYQHRRLLAAISESQLFSEPSRAQTQSPARASSQPARSEPPARGLSVLIRTACYTGNFRRHHTSLYNYVNFCSISFFDTGLIPRGWPAHRKTSPWMVHTHGPLLAKLKIVEQSELFEGFIVTEFL